MFWMEKELILIIPCIVIGFTVHEFFHAYTSYKLGDYTAREDGRVTLNPLKHIDIIGFISLLLLGFGWAKPVQVNPRYYQNSAKGIALVSIAGPLSNFVLAIIGIILNIIFKYEYLGLFFTYFWMINLGMCIFNLIPIPPLDGSKILGYFMPSDGYQAYLNNEQFGLVLLLLMIYTNIFSYITTPIYEFVYHFIYGGYL